MQWFAVPAGARNARPKATPATGAAPSSVRSATCAVCVDARPASHPRLPRHPRTALRSADQRRCRHERGAAAHLQPNGGTRFVVDGHFHGEVAYLVERQVD